MAVSKVILNGQTLIDVTQKTVTSESMLNGITALKNDGTDITGSISIPAPSDTTPAALGTASAGSSTSWSRGDHVHPYPDIIYIGTSAPTNTDIELWLDTDEPGVSVVSSVNSKTGTVVLDADDVGAISKPSSPATGAFLVWNGTAWVAQTLSTWQGGSY